MRHTQTPWSIYGGRIVNNAGDAELGNWHVCSPRWKEDAQHIVKCVNVHDELLEALEEAHGIIKTLYTSAGIPHSGGSWEARENTIKKAKGE